MIDIIKMVLFKYVYQAKLGINIDIIMVNTVNTGNDTYNMMYVVMVF